MKKFIFQGAALLCTLGMSILLASSCGLIPPPLYDESTEPWTLPAYISTTEEQTTLAETSVPAVTDESSSHGEASSRTVPDPKPVSTDLIPPEQCGQHIWVRSDKPCAEEPHCSRCGLVNTNVALEPHSWSAATCSEAKKCTVCGAHIGTVDPTAHKWGSDGKCVYCGADKTSSTVPTTHTTTLPADVEDPPKQTETTKIDPPKTTEPTKPDVSKTTTEPIKTTTVKESPKFPIVPANPMAKG